MRDPSVSRSEGPPMEARLIVDEPQHRQAENLLRSARGSIYEAFDQLDCGFDHEAALAYLMGSVGFQTLPEDQRGKVAGMCMGFGITAVIFERLRDSRTWAFACREARQQLEAMTEARDLCKRQTADVSERYLALRRWLRDEHPDLYEAMPDA